MRLPTILVAIAMTACVPILFAAPASAQATRTWVSGVGDDANPCSRTAPCKTFPGAISKTAIGGEIDVLDPGGFGAVTITKAMTIASEGAGEGGILVAGTNGVTVNCTTDPNCVVILRGLQIDGGPIGSNSLAGVRLISGGTLMIQNCTIRNFTGGSPNGYGVMFTPSGASKLTVSDSIIVTNGQVSGGTGGGIFVQPTTGGSAKVALNNVTIENNVLGVRADGTNSNVGIMMSIENSVVSANAFAGITSFAQTGGAPTKVVVDRTTSSNNGTGLNANGAAATMRIGSSVITGNATGVAIANTATMTSLGNNQIFDNTNAGATIPIGGPS